MDNTVVKLLTRNREVRICIADVTTLTASGRYGKGESAILSEVYDPIFVNSCLLRGLINENDARVSVAVRFRPNGYTANAEIEGNGRVNCTLSPALAAFNGGYADLATAGGTMSITRGSWKGGMATGSVELSETSIDSCFTKFFAESEQTRTKFLTSFETGSSRGVLVQPLPNYNEDYFNTLVDRVTNSIDLIATYDLCDIHRDVFPDATVVESHELRSECGCSKKVFFWLLMSIEIKDLKESIRVGKSEKIVCGVCGREVVYEESDLKEIVRIKEGRESEKIHEDWRSCFNSRSNRPHTSIL